MIMNKKKGREIGEEVDDDDDEEKEYIMMKSIEERDRDRPRVY